VYVELGGSGSAQRAAARELLLRSLIAGAGIVLLLWLAFADARRLLLVLANIPFALVGGVFAVALTGGAMSLGSLVGFVTLFGITTRNAIMLISHYDHLVRVEGERWGPAAAIRGASERLGPILMTALVTGLGLLPLALGSGDPGREIEGPLAIVILGGLVTSTALSLFVLPTLALKFGRFGERA
jgi:Cu/Ag efflux pump CusA